MMRRAIYMSALALAILLSMSPGAEAGKRRRLRKQFNAAAKKRPQYPFNKASGGDKSGVVGRSLHGAPPRVDGTTRKKKNNKQPLGPKI